MTTRGFRPRAERAETARTAEPVLDEAQRAVLALPDGASASVLGAPGTGKTTTLVEALAERVLHRGYGTGEVLALSASRTAATALRDRIALRLGVPTNGPLARTATSLAFQLAGERARREGEEPPRLLTGGEQDQIIAELLAGHIEDGAGPLWPEPLGEEVRSLRGFRTELRELMARCAEHGVTLSRLSELGAMTGRDEWRAAARFVAEYQLVVDSYRGGFVDSAELIASAVAVAAGGSSLDRLRAVFVDDLQEATAATIALLRALAGRGIAVVAFGDPDVASTTFRGAEATALGLLEARLGVPVTRFVLGTAHRQTPALRELTARVTERIGAAAAGVQRAAASGRPAGDAGRPEVVVVEASSAPAEAARLARRLRERHLLDGVPWNEMAVVVRSGAHVPGLARQLAVAEVPTKTSIAGRALRDDYAARQLLTLAGVELGTVELTPAVASELLLGPFGGLDAVSLRRLRLALRQEELAGEGNRPADELLVEALGAPGRFATIDAAHARRAGRLADTLHAGREKAAAGATIEELLWHGWERSGLAARWLEQSERGGIVADEANRHLDGVVALFTAARRFVERSPERPASDFVVELLGAEVPEDTLAAQTAGEAVLVCTPSATIGREFEVVAVAGLQEGVWPNLRLRGSLLHPQEVPAALLGARAGEDAADERAEVLGDELRMFALAVSRARGQVLLTATANDDEQPSPFLRLASGLAEEDASAELHPLSLRGMVGRLRRRLATTGSPDAASALARLAEAGVEGADPEEWYGLAEPSTTEPLVDPDDPEAVVRVSPSRLETFEKSPLAWFVDAMASSPSGLAAGIGTVVHAVMEEAAASADGDLSVEHLWGGVERRWRELSFESPWLEEKERRRTRRLTEGVSEYLRDFERAGGRLLGSEGEFELRLGRALVRGTIDRVERTPEGTVVIVDLKTGNRFPTKAQAAAHAQLGMYQLALEHGAIPAAEGLVSGGAKLLFVSSGVGGKSYREAAQERVDEEGLRRLEERVARAAEGMGAATFAGVVDLGERDPHARYEYRIHLVPAVSA